MHDCPSQSVDKSAKMQQQQNTNQKKTHSVLLFIKPLYVIYKHLYSSSISCYLSGLPPQVYPLQHLDC